MTTLTAELSSTPDQRRYQWQRKPYGAHRGPERQREPLPAREQQGKAHCPESRDASPAIAATCSHIVRAAQAGHGARSVREETTLLLRVVVVIATCITIQNARSSEKHVYFLKLTNSFLSNSFQTGAYRQSFSISVKLHQNHRS